MSRAVRTGGSFDPKTHKKLRRYQIRATPDEGQFRWWARVPYGTWNAFLSWEDASRWLTQKHGQRVAKARRESERHA